MRENYNSIKYWENVVIENKTIRGHMFMQDVPNEKSLYFHTMIFSKKNGINNDTTEYLKKIKLKKKININLNNDSLYKIEF